MLNSTIFLLHANVRFVQKVLHFPRFGTRKFFCHYYQVMALYDDDDDEEVPQKQEVVPPPAAPNKGAADITRKFLQQQLAQKKTNINQPVSYLFAFLGDTLFS